MKEPGRVLVLDGDSVSSLDIVRSLGGAGLSVCAAAADRRAISFRSRFASRTALYPHPAAAPAQFVEWLDSHLRQNPYELVIPVTDLTVIPISRNYEHFSRLTKLATERYEVMEVVYDKSKTIRLAQDVGVPVPMSTSVTSEEQLHDVAGSLSYPVVCKPSRSMIWSNGAGRGLSVFYAFTPSDLIARATPLMAICPIIIQEYHRGKGIGLELLADEGAILQEFQHERLHEIPLTGGGSTYRVSVPVDPHLRGYASALLSRLAWTGVAMVEFKVHEGSGDVYLMEINGRFWGSLPLSTRCGMSFAWDLYELLVRQTAPTPRRYTVGTRCRQIRRDVQWFWENLALRDTSPIVSAGMVRKLPMSEISAEFMRVLSPFEKYDVQVVNDPVPGIIDLSRSVSDGIALVYRRLRGFLGDPIWSCWQWLWRRRQLSDRLIDTRKLLFVCYGNILRSPFAAEYCARRLNTLNRPVAVRSAGTLDKEARRPPHVAVSVARGWDVDLSCHRSRASTADVVGWADVILVMERANMEYFRKTWPDAVHKVFPLGLLGAQGPLDVNISDPYGLGEGATRSAYQRIAAAVDTLIESITSVRESTTQRPA